MPIGRYENRYIRAAIEPAQGYYELGMFSDAWTALDDLPAQDKDHPLIIMLRLDILLALHRLDDAVVLGSGACRQWPVVDGFYIITVAALIGLSEYAKAKDLLLAAPSSLQQKASYWYDLSRCQSQTGDVLSARKSLRECIIRNKRFRAKALDDPDLEAVWQSLG